MANPETKYQDSEYLWQRELWRRFRREVSDDATAEKVCAITVEEIERMSDRHHWNCNGINWDD